MPSWTAVEVVAVEVGEVIDITDDVDDELVCVLVEDAGMV